MVQMNGLGGRHRTLGLQLAKTQALLYNKYHYVLHNDWVLIINFVEQFDFYKLNVNLTEIIFKCSLDLE